MMKRSKHVIISRILDICQNGANKTRIVYQANLNFRTVDPYLKLLTEKGFINTKQDPSLVYETTEKGTELLGSLKAIQREIYQ